MNRKNILATIILLATAHFSIAGTPLGTAFTYQGQLKSGGTAYTGTADIQFTLYDAATLGNVVAGPIASGNVQVTNGLFTTTVDFGSTAFNGDARWLQIAVVTPAGGGSYIPLSPRQAVTPTPYALALPGLRTSQNGAFPSIIGGHGENSVTSGILSATVSGGGNTDAPNRATDHYSTVSGGEDNQAGNGDTNLMNSGWSTVAGGTHNIAGGMYSVVSGGIQNTASGGIATAVGGYGNTASGYLGTTLGGTYNTAQGQNSTAAGSYARALHDGCFVWGDASVPFLTWFDSTNPNQFLIRAAGGVGINTTSPTSALTVQGMIESRSEGFKFPDGTVQTTAAGGGGDLTLPYAGSISLPDGSAFDITNWGVQGAAISGVAGGDNGTAVEGDAQGASAIGVRGLGSGTGAWGGFFQASNETSDLVLGGSIGQINSDPNVSDSRLVLSSRQNVTVHLDTDNNSDGEFQILSSDGTNVCSITENGRLTANSMSCFGQFISWSTTGLSDIMLDPNMNGGYFAMREASGGNVTFEALAQAYGSGSQVNLKDVNGVTRLQLTAATSEVKLFDSTSATTIRLDGVGGRVSTRSLEITAGDLLLNTNAGSLRLRSASSGDGWGLATADSGQTLVFQEQPAGGSSANRLALKFGGNVGIGTTTPSERLTVSGNICATGTIGACSDSRFKQHVEPLADALAKVSKLQAVRFDWKREEFPVRAFSDARQVGFVAQEVEKVLPEVVSRGSDGYYSVDYGRLTPVLAEAIKEQQKRIDEVIKEKDAQIAAQQAEIDKLSARLARVEQLVSTMVTEQKGDAR